MNSMSYNKNGITKIQNGKNYKIYTSGFIAYFHTVINTLQAQKKHFALYYYDNKYLLFDISFFTCPLFLIGFIFNTFKLFH